jgi:zinc D-Ala-D-Ala dipeptidase
MFQKITLVSQSEINKSIISERVQKYLSRDLYNIKNQYTNNNEKLILIKPSANIRVEPFWFDKPLYIEDEKLKYLLDVEGKLMSKYIETNPNFGVLARETVFKKLLDAANDLATKDKYNLVLKIGYRPISVQYQLFNEVAAYFRSKNKTLSEEIIKSKTLEFVTHPDINIPPHSTGAAVDLTLFDNIAKTYIDMGSPINFPDELSWTFNLMSLTSVQQSNRKFLTNLMVSHGFANLASEWWHYSYGDPRWAVFYDKDSLYGVADY